MRKFSQPDERKSSHYELLHMVTLHQFQVRMSASSNVFVQPRPDAVGSFSEWQGEEVRMPAGHSKDQAESMHTMWSNAIMATIVSSCCLQTTDTHMPRNR